VEVEGGGARCWVGGGGERAVRWVVGWRFEVDIEFVRGWTFGETIDGGEKAASRRRCFILVERIMREV
jgi:hypothetical protein